MSDASLPVQTSLFAKLDGALSVAVHDHVPQDEPGSFVVIGDGTEIPADTKTYHGVQHQIEVSVYSSQRGMTETKTILGQIYNLLHRKTLDVQGFGSTMLQFDSQVMFPEPAGYRGVIRFRFNTNSL